MNVAFAGLRHSHIFALFEMIKKHPSFTIIGGYEEQEEARCMAKTKGLACNYQTYEELLQDERVELVVLGGCYADRGPMAIQALKAKKHVMSDKPLCTSLEELNLIEWKK